MINHLATLLTNYYIKKGKIGYSSVENMLK